MITSTRIRTTVLTMATAAVLAVSFGTTAEAADFTVTSTADSGAPGTLRTAINDATASTDATDRIVFGSGVTGTINLTSSLPPLPSPLEIKGPGSDKLAIDGGDTHSIFVALSDVTISGLALENGRSPAAGGAVLLANGTSVLDGVRIESSESTTGGGVVMQSGSFTIKDSQLIDNKATNGGGGFAADSARLQIIGTSFSGNTARFGAGGYINGGEQDSATITGSRFTNNTAVQGGGGLAVFTPTVDDYQAMPTEITGSTFTGNKSTDSSIDNPLGGGAIFTGSSDMDIDSSLFEGNSSATIGGAVYLNAPLPANLASIQNSTLVGNSANLAGGAIANLSVGLKVDSATVTGNKTTNPYQPEYNGAGFIAFLPAAVTNSIVTGNVPADISGSVPEGMDEGIFIKGSFNLIGKIPDATYTEAVAGSDLISPNPKLGPLADNGGPTRTMLPAGDSPVVNKGLTFLDTDQRGLLRPIRFGSIPFSKAKQANGVDIGAVELQTNKFTFGKVKLKRRTGIAILPVLLPSGGKIALKGSGTVKGQSKSAKKLATVKFQIRAKGKALKKLRRVGTVKVKFAFTFRPTGGIASNKSKSMRLAMKKHRGNR